MTHRRTSRGLLRNQKAFLIAYATCGTITGAAQAAGLSRIIHYKWMDENEDYRKAFEEAQAEADDRLIMEARRRAVEGVDVPVIHHGKIQTQKVNGKRVPITLKKYSDAMLMFLIAGRMPQYNQKRLDIRATMTKDKDALASMREKLRQLQSDPEAVKAMEQLNDRLNKLDVIDVEAKSLPAKKNGRAARSLTGGNGNGNGNGKL